MGKPLKVELEVGAAEPIPFEISEEWIDGDRDPRVAVILVDEGRDRRARYRSAAMEIMRRMVEENLEHAITVTTGDSAFIIPKFAIRWVRLQDPEGGNDGRGLIGFGRQEGG